MREMLRLACSELPDSEDSLVATRYEIIA